MSICVFIFLRTTLIKPAATRTSEIWKMTKSSSTLNISACSECTISSIHASRRFFGRNRYQLSFIVFGVFSLAVSGHATVGLFVDLEDKLDEVEIVLTTTQFVWNLRSHFVWNLFGVFRADFLAVDPCRKRAGILHETRARSSRFVVAYTRIALLLIQQWGHFLRTSSLDSKARITDWWTLTVSDTQQIDGRVQRVLCFVLHTGVPLIAIHLGVCFFLSGVMSISFSWMIIVNTVFSLGRFKESDTEKTSKLVGSDLEFYTDFTMPIKARRKSCFLP